MLTAYAYRRIVSVVRRITLAQARKKAGLTQDQLAALSGVDQTTISSLETGRKDSPLFDTVLRLARALNVAPEQLRFGVRDQEVKAS